MGDVNEEQHGGSCVWRRTQGNGLIVKCFCYLWWLFGGKTIYHLARCTVIPMDDGFVVICQCNREVPQEQR